MKANAPEKIILSADRETGILYDEWVIEDRTDSIKIKYVRKDAFIEKAASWIENNLSKYSELTDEDEYGNKLKEPEMNVFYGQAVKDFRNYMKRE